MNRLVITNSVILLLILTLFIFGDYLLPYPPDFNLNRYLRDAPWQQLAIIFLALISAAAILSDVPVKSYRPAKKFFIFLAALQLLFFLFIVLKMAEYSFQRKNEFEQFATEYKKKAESDIKAGFIIIDYTGGLEHRGDEREQRMHREIDSVTRTFGLAYRNSGCIIDPALIKAQEEYIKFTKSFLDKRNGAGWEEKMKQKIEVIRNNYR